METTEKYGDERNMHYVAETPGYFETLGGERRNRKKDGPQGCRLTATQCKIDVTHQAEQEPHRDHLCRVNLYSRGDGRRGNLSCVIRLREILPHCKGDYNPLHASSYDRYDS